MCVGCAFVRRGGGWGACAPAGQGWLYRMRLRLQLACSAELLPCSAAAGTLYMSMQWVGWPSASSNYVNKQWPAGRVTHLSVCASSLHRPLTSPNTQAEEARRAAAEAASRPPSAPSAAAGVRGGPWGFSGGGGGVAAAGHTAAAGAGGGGGGRAGSAGSAPPLTRIASDRPS